MKNNSGITRTPRTPNPADPRTTASRGSAPAYPVVRRTAKFPVAPAWQRRTHIPAGGSPAPDAKSYPPALPVHTPQLYLWSGEIEKPSRRRFLRRQHPFTFK